jgi:glycosyltransferase involved in cell wall biosynthesis
MNYCKPTPLFFSVVIPLYNKGPHIDRCISSVINQTNKNFEIIVVDDGSTDGGLIHLEKYSDPRLKTYRKENGGAASARNYAISKSSGDYIAFLDADDEWSDEHLESLASLHTLAPSAIYLGTGYQKVSNGVVVKKVQLDESEEGRVINDYMKAFSKTMPLSHSSSTAIRKDLLLSIGGFPCEPRYFEDWNVWLKVAMLGSVAYSSKITATLHMDAVNRSYNDYTALNRLSALQYLAGSLEKFSNNSNVIIHNYNVVIENALEDYLKGCILEKQWQIIDKIKYGRLSKYLDFRQRIFYLSRLNRVLRVAYFFKVKVFG